MFCKFCGKELEEKSKFCSSCGKNLEVISSNKTTDVSSLNIVSWIITIVAIGLLLLSFALALDLGEEIEIEEIILPAILSLLSFAGSIYVFLINKNIEKNNLLKFRSILCVIIAIGSLLLSLELCLGPLIGKLTS